MKSLPEIALKVFIHKFALQVFLINCAFTLCLEVRKKRLEKESSFLTFYGSMLMNKEQIIMMKFAVEQSAEKKHWEILQSLLQKITVYLTCIIMMKIFSRKCCLLWWKKVTKCLIIINPIVQTFSDISIIMF